jgi:DNA-binding CsgD family transcriptional regulator
MRVLLVGRPSDRARLRSQIDGSLEIVGEFESVAAADAADTDADAIVIVNRRGARIANVLERTDGQGLGADRSMFAGEDEAIDEALTAREIQVLELLAEGLTNKAIAGRLGISDQTVKFHVASIAGKLGARNRTDAVRRAVRRGLIML